MRNEGSPRDFLYDGDTNHNFGKQKGEKRFTIVSFYFSDGRIFTEGLKIDCGTFFP